MAVGRLGEGLHRHIGKLKGEAEDAFFEATHYTEDVTAPATGALLQLATGPIVEANLTVKRISDSFIYTSGTHYLEDVAGAFENVSITPGTALRVDYFVPQSSSGSSASAAESPVEAASPLTPSGGYTNVSGCGAGIYRDRERAYLSGRIEATGSVSAATEILTLPSGRIPVCTAHLPAAAEGGTTYLIADTDGSVSLGEGLAAGWLSLEGLHWRVALPLATWTSWGQEDLTFGDLTTYTFGDLT